MSESLDLQSALAHPLWVAHTIGKEYSMDNVPGWKIAYYPIFEDGHTGEVYEEPKALVEKPGQWKIKAKGKKDEIVTGTDFREVPLRYLK
jgi:hypothetical protein